jgi:lipopolysaccharide biosynthesis glycosyltransferase
MYLDMITPTKVQVSHGELGTMGFMGYPMKLSINGQFFEHCLSAHPPSSLHYQLDRGFQKLSCHVALNDTASDQAEATFMVYADGVLQAVAARVRRGERPRPLEARLYGAKNITLVIETQGADWCHAVWIDPVLHESASLVMSGALNRTHLLLPEKPRIVRRCIAMIVDDHVADMADNCLGSLYQNGDVRDCHLLIIADEKSKKVSRLAQKYGAQIAEVRRVVEDVPAWIKTALYSVAHYIQADQYLIIDADMLVIKQVRSIFNMLDGANDLSVFCARELWIPRTVTLGNILNMQEEPYGADPESLDLLRMSQRERDYGFIVNSGVVAGTRKAMLALDNAMRSMSPEGILWMDRCTERPWREQALFNLALARLDSGQELDIRYNFQLLWGEASIHVKENHVVASADAKPIHILHYNGIPGRAKYKGMEGIYTNVSPCKFSGHSTKAQEEFLELVYRYAAGQVSRENTLSAHSYESMMKMDNVLRFVHHICTEKRPEKILDINTFEGVIGGCLSTYALENKGAMVRISNRHSPLVDSLSDETKEVIKPIDGEIFVECKSLHKQKESFDLIAMDTSLNEKNTSMLIMLASRMISKNGCILIHDRDNSFCDMDVVAEKLRSEGLKITSNQKFRPSFDNQKVYVIEAEDRESRGR